MQNSDDKYDQIHKKRKINHFPCAGHLCIKDQLYRVLKKQRALFGNIYNFSPITFTLPNDYSKFVDYFMQRRSKVNNSNDLYAMQDDKINQNTIYL